ncbi:hypothetical protein BC628DRAFT_806898 [Trametes gibbosa]|nr:hypothetical protein BC628DRAFT_806898 [Trametes gibbosa]
MDEYPVTTARYQRANESPCRSTSPDQCIALNIVPEIRPQASGCACLPNPNPRLPARFTSPIPSDFFPPPSETNSANSLCQDSEPSRSSSDMPCDPPPYCHRRSPRQLPSPSNACTPTPSPSVGEQTPPTCDTRQLL